MTQAVALITLSIYIAMLIGISVYTSRSTRTMDGFLLGNRNIGPWMSLTLRYWYSGASYQMSEISRSYSSATPGSLLSRAEPTEGEVRIMIFLI